MTSPRTASMSKSGLATQAAQFVADRLTTQAPISTLAGQSQG